MENHVPKVIEYAESDVWDEPANIEKDEVVKMNEEKLDEVKETMPINPDQKVDDKEI